jgi:hypothetical protein
MYDHLFLIEQQLLSLFQASLELYPLRLQHLRQSQPQARRRSGVLTISVFQTNPAHQPVTQAIGRFAHICILKHNIRWKELLMTNSLPLRKPVKWGRLLIGGALSVLVIAITSLWFAYKADPQSVIWLYYLLARYGVNIGDGGVLSGVPCSAPCVFGIQAGETQFDQVLPTLGKNGIASSKCLQEPSVSWYLFTCGADRLNVQVDTHTNIVSAVWLHPNDAISFGAIIEKYGEPNYVTLDQEGLDTIHPRFYWNSMRMVVVVPEIPGNTYDVEKVTAVEGVSFSDENLYRLADKETSLYYKPWKGYGIYQAPVITIPLTPMSTVAPTPSMTP